MFKGIYLLDSYAEFAGSIVQGNYDEGHRVILLRDPPK